MYFIKYALAVKLFNVQIMFPTSSRLRFDDRFLLSLLIFSLSPLSLISVFQIRFFMILMYSRIEPPPFNDFKIHKKNVLFYILYNSSFNLELKWTKLMLFFSLVHYVNMNYKIFKNFNNKHH